MVRPVRGYELTRVAIVLIPSLLASVQRSRVGVGLRFQVVNRIDCRCRITITHSDHNSVLIRAHDV